MSGFTALNVEPEDTVEEEIDDTKEIQLEEAFKLYQNALKLHSQGPAFYEEAGDAYEELFKSEVFKYPEVVSEYAHDQIDDDPSVAPVPAESDALDLLPSNAAESSANSIPQLVYLSYKNKGQFSLDTAHHQLGEALATREEVSLYYANSCNLTLKDFAEALERDDSDLDLWKKAARVADVLTTHRIARFCLESVLAGDDDGSEQTIDLSGLDEAFAAGELDKVISIIQDDLSKARKGDARPRQALLRLLSKSSDPYRFLPKRAQQLEYLTQQRKPAAPAVTYKSLHSDNLASLGQELLQIIMNHQDGANSISASTIISVELPELQHSPEDVDMTVREENLHAQSTEGKPQSAIFTQEVANAASDDGPAKSGITNEEPEPANTGDALEKAAATVEDDNEPPDNTDTIDDQSARKPSVNLPTRKRSSTTAGIEEPEGRTKSKRLRARESIAELTTHDDETVHEVPKFYHDQLAVLEAADLDVFSVVNTILQKLNMQQYGTLEQIRLDFWGESKEEDEESGAPRDSMSRILSADLHKALTSWTDEHSQAIVYGHGSQDFVEKSTGLTLFLQHSRPAIQKEIESSVLENQKDILAFIDLINSTPTNLYDASFTWLLTVLTSGALIDGSDSSSYMRETWSADLKQTIVRLIICSEEYLYDALMQHYLQITERCSRKLEGKLKTHIHDPVILLELVQTIFELHLDIYCSITNPSSQVDHSTRVKQCNSLQRWAGLADDFMQIYLETANAASLTDGLIVRFIWASATYAAQAEDVDQNHVILCLQDLRQLLMKLEVDAINLPNNAAMPQISVAAIDQEISRLSTLDFFVSVFDSDNSDPVAVVEKLEPILEPYSIELSDSDTMSAGGDHKSQVQKLIQFLDSGDASLKLFLWRRLQNAYTAISYTPKVVSCLLRAVETILDELRTERHTSTDEHHRQLSMLKWLKDVDELVIKIITKFLNEATAFDSIDTAHLSTSLAAVTSILRILHGVALYEDAVRVGQIAPPQLKGASSTKMYEKSKDRLREMQVRLWTLQYALFKEAASQNPELFPAAADDLADYLSTVHHALGQRHYCKYSNKAFIRLIKGELSTLKTSKDYAADMAQAFFDLYQLRFAVGIGDYDHGCPSETLDKKTALSLIPTIMTYASRLNMKDLIKSELKGTIEKIQAASGALKSPQSLLYNKKLISAYLKSPVIPSELYNCIKGVGDLPTKPVTSDNALKASHGWYFMLGYMTLAKYRSVKRSNPTPTDDLDVAASLLRQDLEHDMEKWETWYRLAQIFEAKIEDDLIWNSAKLNDSRSEIALLERNAIHSYTMAIAIAMRSADDGLMTTQIGELFQEFAHRLYSSSREPLNMEAFKTDKNIRHLSNSLTQAMSKQPFHQPMTRYNVWSLASYLLRRKFTDKPKPWTSHYTLAKCLWKMFQSPENIRARRPIAAEEVLEACIDAIETLPKKEKTNEYILEPHFKLVSIVHKMVRRQTLKPSKGVEWLQATRFAQKAHLSEDEEGRSDWEPYILDILKKLGHADKSNWHHRIIARAAHVIYDDQPGIAGALGAKHEFTQQIFTKTMTLQVWKPEFERPGRHYVYTGRYVLFFVHLLEQLNDRASLDQLIRRIRRRPTDFIDHPKIWEQVTTTYLRLLRRVGKIPEGRERMVFDPISYEEFTKNSEKLEGWALDPETTSIVLDIMRDAIELKKLNNSLMKGSLIDELIGDSYACMYEAFISQLPPEQQPPPPPPALPQGTFINITSDNVPTGDNGRDRMRMGNFFIQAEDTPNPTPVPVGLGLQTPGHPIAGGPPQAVVETRNPPPAKPGRAKTITRREIQRKAEAAIVKPPPIKTPILSKRPVIEIPSAGYFGNDGPVNGRLNGVKDEDGQDSRASSRRGSIHDSADGEGDADDESELSGLEDLGKEKKSLFPGLMGKVKAGDETNDNSSIGGDDGEEGDGEGDDEGEEEDAGDGEGDGEDNDDRMDTDGEVEIQDSQEAQADEEEQDKAPDLKAAEHTDG